MSRREPPSIVFATALVPAPVHAALRSAESALAEAGIESARLDAELLLAEVRGCGRARLLAELREALDEAQRERFARLVERRIRREPIAYLLGSAWFHGLEFEVTPAVLIPRPETELLVDWALAWLGNERRSGPIEIIDVGTGSGAIALSVAHALNSGLSKGSLATAAGHSSEGAKTQAKVSIHASDISSDALMVARSNAKRFGLASSVQFVEADLLPEAPPSFDLVLANLPYIGLDDRERVMEDVDRYEPHVALYSGKDGLDHFDRLIASLEGRVAEGAAIALEIGDRQGPALMERLARDFPSAKLAIHQDLAGLDRLVTVEAIGSLQGAAAAGEAKGSTMREEAARASSGPTDG